MKQELFRPQTRERPSGTSLEQTAISREAVWWFVRLLSVLALVGIASASAITGQIINRSTGEPAAGDEVILYRVDPAMHELERTRSDERGTFSFSNQIDTRHLIAVFHQGVSYHTHAIVGSAPVELSVYDAVPVLKSVRLDSDTLFFESGTNTLTVTEFFVLSNRSDPPRTLAAKTTFDFALPQQGSLESVAVQPPETLPFRTNALPAELRGQYRISYPLRPGVTTLRVVYHVPYSGRVSVTPVLLHPVAAMALMVPTTMRLVSPGRTGFAYQNEETGLAKFVATNLRRGASPTFELSGSGRLKTSKAAIILATIGTLRPALRSAAPSQLVSTGPNRLFTPMAHRTLLLGCVFFTLLFVGLLNAACTLKKHSVHRCRETTAFKASGAV
jgi:hypothetical protein